MSAEGFPKDARLRHRSEFQKIRNEGRSVVGRYFRLNALNGNPGEQARLGIITTRKFGGAVERNRFRRRIREVARRSLAQFRPGVWMVVIARREATRAGIGDLRDEWLRLARKLSILRDFS